MPSRKSGIALLLLLCALARAAQAKENAMLEWLRSADTLSKEQAAALEVGLSPCCGTTCVYAASRFAAPQRLP